MPDFIAPELGFLTIPSRIESGGLLTLSAGASDDASGIAQVVVWFSGSLSYSFASSPTWYDSYSLVGLFGASDSWSDGVVTESFGIDPTNIPGAYSVTRVTVRDTSGNTRTYSPTELKEMGVNTSVVLAGTVADTTAPMLTAFRLPASTDVSSGAAPMTITAAASDAASDIDQVIVTLDQSLTYATGTTGHDSFSIIALSGETDSWTDGTSSETLSISDINTPGHYDITRVSVRDSAGNTRVYTAQDLAELGFSTGFDVLAATPDLVAPDLLSLSIPDRIDLTGGDALTYIGARARDDDSGVASLSIMLETPLDYAISGDGTAVQSHAILGLYGLSDGWDDGYSGQGFTISTLNAPGAYRIAEVRVTDLAGNTRSYDRAALDAMGATTTIELAGGILRETDPYAVFKADALRLVEGTTASWQLSFLQLSDAAFSWSWDIAAGTAGAGDFIAASGAGAHAALSGTTGQNVSIDMTALSDALSETNETAWLTITLQGITFADASPVLRMPITIVDNARPVGRPAITGNRIEGATLWVDLGNVSDADGIASGGVQWYRDGWAIPNATGRSLVLGEEDLGHEISASYSYTDRDGIAEMATSLPTSEIWLGWAVTRARSFDLADWNETSTSLTLTGSDHLTGAGNSKANTLTGNAGNNLLDGRAGADTIHGNNGGDTIIGGDGWDRLHGDNGADRLVGNQGSDWLHGGADDDTLLGGLGDDTLLGALGDDQLDGWDGNDRLDGWNGNDWISGGAGADTLLGGTGADTLLGGAGNDHLDAADGNDSLDGGAGDDTLQGGTGQDTLQGNAGNDRLADAGGRDRMFGGDGDDWLAGGADADFLVGGQGSDTLFGGGGDDTFYGGTQNDRLEGAGGADLVNGGGGADTLRGGGGADTLRGEAGDDLLEGGAQDDRLEGGNGDDLMRGGAQNDTLIGGAGADTLLGQAGSDLIDGGNGADLIDGGSHGDTIRGGIDNDTVRGGDGPDLVFLDDGDDLFEDNDQGGASGADTVYGGRGNDTILGGGGNDLLHGNIGNDLVEGGAGRDTLTGASGADTLTGGGGNDVLSGGAGWDRLAGGAGGDTLTGGGGVDVFVFDTGSGRDRVTDFEPGRDVLELDVDRTDMGALTLQQTVEGLRVDWGPGSVMLLGLTTSDLLDSDVLFV
ncbi:calcium-binding protein [Salipiger aestuarii]|uniref:calcium-binding protein n=1 Tax=Salipiger aestuarii TaxID=568098 RepID=UPI00123911CB|nr:calcium-binding protein [Salipiger aestuarii]